MYRSGLVQRPQPAATDSFVVRLVVCDEDVDAGRVPVAVAFGNKRTRRKREIVQVSAFRQHPCIPSLAGCGGLTVWRRRHSVSELNTILM